MKASVVVISSIDWHFTWQRHQNIASGLAERGYAVTFVEPLPKRWPRLRETGRALRRIVGNTPAGPCRQRLPAGVSIVSPRLVPDVGSWAQWVNRVFFVPRIARTVEGRGLQRPLVVMNYLPTRSSLALQRALSADLKIYDCAWDWSNDPYSVGLERIESDLVRESDLVFTDSPHNTRRMRELHPNVVPIAHGVDFDLFAAVAGTPATASDPVSCAYFGDLGTNVDFDLLREVSHRHPLSLIGPVRASLAGFSPRTTIHGPVPHERVPEHLRDARVLLLPYRATPDMRGVLPAKIMECLATGKPTVATRLPSLESFQDLIYWCRSAADFLGAIVAAAKEDPARRAARREFASHNSWRHRVTEIESLIEARLAQASPAGTTRASV